MSAIAGIYHSNNEPISSGHSAGMMQALQKFPADDIQMWQKENVFLGCHAQWITPESIGEQLPFYDNERQLAITADAIIDNREDLFQWLQVDKSKRDGMPDSQIILLAYQKWGEDSPKYLIGDFAFMIWDEKKHLLFGARDFSGGRTLYYHYTQQRFSFCTTIEPLLSIPYIKRELNQQWLAEYLAISAVIDTVDASKTPFKDLEQLPPAHTISVINERVTIMNYSTLTTDEQLKLKSNSDYVEAFQEVFQKAVKSRLRTHHQVGSQLSGGLDSGAVVGYAAKEMKTEKKLLHTFSYIPPNDFQDYTPKQLLPDERPFIKSTVDYVGGINDHYLDFEGKDSFSEIDDVLDIIEMPYKFFENSFWQKGIYEKAQEEGIGVLLNGGRGNLSVSWGSALDYYSILFKKIRWVKLFKELNQYSKNVGGPRLRRLPKIVKIAYPGINNLSSSGASYNIPSIINKEFAKDMGVYNKIGNYGMKETGWFSSGNVYEQRRRHFEDGFHWNASNTKATKLSLRHSLWERDPTNDIRVIRFCLSIPEGQYVQNGMDRSLIRRATENYLPDNVRLNQSYRGVQGADWVHRMAPFWSVFIKELEKISDDKTILEFIDSEVIQNALLRVKEGALPERAIDPNYRVLMRILIVSRFIKSFF